MLSSICFPTIFSVAFPQILTYTDLLETRVHDEKEQYY